jgi:hypothetical protein
LSIIQISGGLQWLTRTAGLQQAGDKSSGEANTPRDNHHPKQKPDQSSEKGHSLLCDRVGILYELNDIERIPIGAGGKATTANSQELTKDTVNRVYARSKGRVKRKGAISVSCEGGLRAKVR